MHDTGTTNALTGSYRYTFFKAHRLKWLYKGYQHVLQHKTTDLSQDLLQEETAKMHWRKREPTKHVPFFVLEDRSATQKSETKGSKNWKALDNCVLWPWRTPHPRTDWKAFRQQVLSAGKATSSGSLRDIC